MLLFDPSVTITVVWRSPGIGLTLEDIELGVLVVDHGEAHVGVAAPALPPLLLHQLPFLLRLGLLRR